jgi:hypothetical protein
VFAEGVMGGEEGAEAQPCHAISPIFVDAGAFGCVIVQVPAYGRTSAGWATRGAPDRTSNVAFLPLFDWTEAGRVREP